MTTAHLLGEHILLGFRTDHGYPLVYRGIVRWLDRHGYARELERFVREGAELREVVFHVPAGPASENWSRVLRFDLVEPSD